MNSLLTHPKVHQANLNKKVMTNDKTKKSNPFFQMFTCTLCNNYNTHRMSSYKRHVKMCSLKSKKISPTLHGQNPPIISPEDPLQIYNFNDSLSQDWEILPNLNSSAEPESEPEREPWTANTLRSKPINLQQPSWKLRLRMQSKSKPVIPKIPCVLPLKARMKNPAVPVAAVKPAERMVNITQDNPPHEDEGSISTDKDTVQEHDHTSEDHETPTPTSKNIPTSSNNTPDQNNLQIIENATDLSFSNGPKMQENTTQYDSNSNSNTKLNDNPTTILLPENEYENKSTESHCCTGLFDTFILFSCEFCPCRTSSFQEFTLHIKREHCIAMGMNQGDFNKQSESEPTNIHDQNIYIHNNENDSFRNTNKKDIEVIVISSDSDSDM